MGMLIASENARELQLKSAIARKRNRELREQAEQLAGESNATQAIDPYVNNLAHAQVKYLARLMDPNVTAKDAAALSQALKNLRETYHMASGQPKPGTIKPERVSSRQQVKPTSEPKLDTTGSGPAS